MKGRYKYKMLLLSVTLGVTLTSYLSLTQAVEVAGGGILIEGG